MLCTILLFTNHHIMVIKIVDTPSKLILSEAT